MVSDQRKRWPNCLDTQATRVLVGPGVGRTAVVERITSCADVRVRLSSGWPEPGMLALALLELMSSTWAREERSQGRGGDQCLSSPSRWAIAAKRRLGALLSM